MNVTLLALICTEDVPAYQKTSSIIVMHGMSRLYYTRRSCANLEMYPLLVLAADKLFAWLQHVMQWYCLQQDCLPSAYKVRQETTKRSGPEVHHTKDGGQVGCLVGREAKLRSQVWRQSVVNCQLHKQNTFNTIGLCNRSYLRNSSLH